MFMFKRSKKSLAIILTLAMMFSLLLPVSGAFAASENRVDKVVSVADDFEGKVGTLTIKEDSVFPNDFKTGESFVITLPSGVEWSTTHMAVYYNEDIQNITPSNDQTLDITIPSVTTEVDKFEIVLGIKVDGAEGDIKVTVDGMDSGITSGSYLIARVSGDDTIAKALDVETIGDVGTGGTIRIEETSVGAIGNDSQEIVLKLPSGFEWASAMDNTKVTFSGGLSGTTFVDADPNTAGVQLFVRNGRDFTVKIDPPDNRTTRGIIQIVPEIKEDGGDFGDIEVNISGDKVDDADVVVAKYADFGVEVSVDEVETVVSGRFGEKTGKLTIEENVANSLIQGRTFTVKFPEWVKVTKVKETEEKGWAIATPVADGTDNEVEFEVTTASSGSAGKLELEFEISVEAGKSGDIEVEISGKAGIDEEIVIAKAVTPVTATANETKVQVGVQSQPIGDIIIAEVDDEYIKEGQVVVELPSNVDWATDPAVEVIEGNLEIDEDSIDTNDEFLTFTVKSESSKPSKIKISGAKVTLDRTIPEGPIVAEIKGAALVENSKSAKGYDDSGDSSTLDGGEFDASTVAEVVVANVVTPAPAQTGSSATFTIGSSIYNVDGVMKPMDVAPYIKDGRTFTPVRYVAEACGVEDIDYDASTKTVTLTKGDTVVKLVIGTKTITINGDSKPMDVAPEITGDRTMLPARYVAEAFGFDVGYDPATKTVVISN